MSHLWVNITIAPVDFIYRVILQYHASRSKGNNENRPPVSSTTPIKPSFCPTVIIAMRFASNTTDSIFDYLDHLNPRNASSVDAKLNLPYTVCEILVAICAVLGNGLVIIVFGKERKLRRRTNYYIISLAAADLLVGLFAIPFAILASIGLPTNLHACLFTVSVLIVLCTISIFCLVAVSIDRYWAILHPMGYSRTVRTKTAIGEGPPFVHSSNVINLISDIGRSCHESNGRRSEVSFFHSHEER